MPIVITSSPTGAVIVSFTAISPPLRYDAQPWETVQISEAPTLSGPWTVIDSQSLSPLDPDPSQPLQRDFTTHLATISEGFYSLTFLDGAGGSSHPLAQIEDNPSAIKPSLSDLGSFMRARTVVAGTGGTEAGTFTAATRPTAAEADAILNQAVEVVLMTVGAEIPDRMLLQARFAVVIYAAQLIELTFFRNEVAKDQSAYAQYVALYKDLLSALKSSIEDAGPAAPEAAFWSVPVLSQRQAHWQAIFAALDPVTGRLDPSKLPPTEYWPMGLGGIPQSIFDMWPLLFGSGLHSLDGGLAFLED